MPAAEHMRMHTESAAITSMTGGRASRSFLQESENLNPGNMPNFSGLGNARLGAAGARRSRVTTGQGPAQSRVMQQQRPASGGARQYGGLQDITNVQENRSRLKSKLAERGREASVASLPGTTIVPPLGGAARPKLSGSAPDIQTPMAMELSPSKVEDRNPQAVVEYKSEIVARLFMEEGAYLPRPNYMETQTDINGKMRAILMDWLVEVHMKYKLRPETLFLAVNLIDRHMSVLPVLRRRLQLVGVAGMFIAAKFEEIDPPRVNDFVYITDNTYTRDDILSMECTMLAALAFDIVVPTPASFADVMLKANQCDDPHHPQLVKYMLELSLIDLRMIKHAPSHLVAAALLLSNELMGRSNIWPESMVQASRYAEPVLRGCVEELRALLRAAPAGSLQAVRKKYLMQQHQCVAIMPAVTSTSL